MKGFRLSAILAFIFWLSWFSVALEAYAIDKSRLLATAAMVSSIGLKFYGASFDKKSQQAYDEYLHTAKQSEMAQHLKDFDDRRSQSILANRISNGMAAFTLTYSIFDELTQSQKNSFGLSLRIDSSPKSALIAFNKEF